MRGAGDRKDVRPADTIRRIAEHEPRIRAGLKSEAEHIATHALIEQQRLESVVPTNTTLKREPARRIQIDPEQANQLRSRATADGVVTPRLCRAVIARSLQVQQTGLNSTLFRK